MRRGVIVVVMVLVALLLGSYVLFTRTVVVELRREAQRTSEMFGEVLAAQDPDVDPASAILELTNDIRESGVPMIVTDAAGNPTATANLPFDESDPRAREWIPKLDAQNTPVNARGLGTNQVIHFGHTRLVRGLQVIPMAQVAILAMLLLAGGYAVQARARADRERVWAGMARESAHQLGTPISSLSGWIELLMDREGDELSQRAVGHMSHDIERLERVAHRFERIGRPPQQELVDAVQVLERVTNYFGARVPTLAHAVTMELKTSGELPLKGDAVLIEWALEAVVKNAVDALAGRGGKIVVEGARLPEGDIRIRVTDDGPGVPRELRRRVFEPGFTTKERGWGIGLALAHRIVAEWHRGSLALVPSDRGARFEFIFPG
ncbi:MAG TPA: HAMP domain-containing sensor histidine kinase [Gemmatimonadaceae bacterium]|nr:HAMP domain-containing sensor histidine kinase [Gemmatimonadaceae bacterium]